jgi:hypothetical protein
MISGKKSIVGDLGPGRSVRPLKLMNLTHFSYSSNVVESWGDKVDSRNICKRWTLSMKLSIYELDSQVGSALGPTDGELLLALSDPVHVDL